VQKPKIKTSLLSLFFFIVVMIIVVVVRAISSLQGEVIYHKPDYLRVDVFKEGLGTQ